jgi:hypothetical protein
MMITAGFEDFVKKMWASCEKCQLFVEIVGHLAAVRQGGDVWRQEILRL